MITRVFSIWLAMLWSAMADASPLALEDPDHGLGRLLRELAGPGGGNQLFYLPTRAEPATPATWGFNYEDVNFNSADGTALHGWFIPARGRDARGTVVFSHGNAGSIGYHIGSVMWLVEAGYHVLLYDYRGYGKSGGTPDRRGMIDDVKAAFAYTARHPGVDGRRLVSFGHSMGGAKSVTAIGESPVRGLRAVVIDGAFASYRTMARLFGGQLGESLVSDDLSPRDYVGKISPVPLLVVHGGRDEVVPVSQGRELFRSARNPKTFFEVEAGRHSDALYRDGEAYRKRVLAWLAETLDD